MTATTITAPRDVALEAFTWLLPGRFAQADSTADGLSGWPGHVLSQAEGLTLWCYVFCVSRLDATAATRAGQLLALLRVCPESAALCRHGLEPVLAALRPRPDAVAVLVTPPAPLRDAITALVVRCLARGQRPRQALTGLQPELFEHPADRACLAALAAVPALGTLAARARDFSRRSRELLLRANGLEVDAASVPALHRCYHEACRALDVRQPPPLYLSPGGLGLFTLGADEPVIVVQSMTASLMDAQEMVFLLGRELGHILAGHPRYLTLAQCLVSCGEELSRWTMGVGGKLIDLAAAPTLHAWVRRAELTADRAGYLACQNREAVLRALMKLAGFPARYFGDMRTRSLVEQAERYDQTASDSALDRMLGLLGGGGTQPFIVSRAAELLAWLDDGSGEEIIEASPEQRQAMAERARQDANQHRLHAAACRCLTAWAAGRFGVARPEAGRIVRGMFHDNRSPAGTPLEPILRVELEAAKQSAGEVGYTLVVLFHERGKALRASLKVPMEADWEQAPKAIRDRFIRVGGQDVQVLLLYSVQAETPA